MIVQRVRKLLEPKMFVEEELEDWVPHRSGWQQYSVAGARLAPHAETEHMVCIGAPGTGKTVVLSHRLEEARSYGHAAVVYDPKGGEDFVTKFYRPGKDIILNPFDVRSPAWALSNELRYAYDMSKLSEALIETPSEGEKFWANNAQIVFSDMNLVLARDGKISNADLDFAANRMPLDALHKLLKGTHGGTLMDPRSEKTAIGIRAELGSHMAAWRYLRDGESYFSIRDWVNRMDEGDDSWLFFSSRADAQAITRPLITLWMEIVIAGILSLQQRPSRRIHLLLDEVATLQKIPSYLTAAAVGRSYGIASALGWQVYSQAKQNLGQNVAESIFGNAKTWVVLNSPEPATAKFLSEAMGDREIKDQKKSRTLALGDDRDSMQISEDKKVEKAVLEGEILNFPRLRGILKTTDAPLLDIKLIPRDRPDVAPAYQLRTDITWDAVVNASKAAQSAKEKLASTPVPAADPPASDPAALAAKVATGFEHRATPAELQELAASGVIPFGGL